MTKPTKPDKSPYTFQAKKRGLELSLDQKIPWTSKQLELFKLIQDKNTKVVFISGPAGCSKSIAAIYMGLQAIKDKKVSDLVYLRSVVESATQKMGFLPGTAEEKLSVYLDPLMEKLEELVGPENSKNLLSKGFVSAKPINFLRGCQFSGKFVIADEAQNFSFGDMTTFITRIGEFSKIIICGDPMQSDIGEKSAFKTFFNLFDDEESKNNGIHTFEFLEEDIVRSEILRFIVKKIKKYKKRSSQTVLYSVTQNYTL